MGAAHRQTTTQFESMVASDVNHYTLQESIWDAVALVGFERVGGASSCSIILGAVVNIFMQTVFTLIVWANMNEPWVDDETIDAIKHWRGISGHYIELADPQ